MPGPRPPWWLLVAAAAFPSYLALFFHAVYRGPALPGVWFLAAVSLSRAARMSR